VGRTVLEALRCACDAQQDLRCACERESSIMKRNRLARFGRGIPG
jgi:hypothetical protein